MHISTRVIPFIVVASLIPSLAFAHSTVSPSQTAASKSENFFVSVPTEKTVPTTGVRLLVPESLQRVTPVVKPGWRIATKKDAKGNVTEIVWSGGSIPNGQKDFFQFSARTPASSTSLIWKVYQTYRSGEVVAWDQAPASAESATHATSTVSNPYSVTTVEAVAPVSHNSGPTNRLSFALSVAALALSVIALWSTRKGHSHA
jgi:uncharacterized protein YcnI